MGNPGQGKHLMMSVTVVSIDYSRARVGDAPLGKLSLIEHRNLLPVRGKIVLPFFS